jgi:hypothetical protein
MEKQDLSYEKTPEFQIFIEKRLQESDANPTGGIPAEEVHRNLREMLRKAETSRAV